MSARGISLMLMLAAVPAAAQDFDLPAPAWPAGPITVWFERALPPASPAPAVAAGVTRWHGIEGLSTRSVAAGAGWRSVRAGLGLSQTGEPDVGWTALAVVAGAAAPRAAASARVVGRRDRTSRFGFDAHGAGVGLELGGGAWFEARAGLHVWASAPQIWTRGAAPPLLRPLEIGGAADLGGVRVWFARAGVGGVARGGRSAGLATTSGPVGLWLIARDRPLRGGFGIAARAGAVRVAAQVDGHPVLRETARLSLEVGGTP